MPRRLVPAAAIAAALFLVGSCAYHGDAGNPIARNLTWFSYLNGDDIRDQCKAGASDRYRFVYNGIYTEQVRSYDVKADSDGRGTVLTVQVLGSRGNIGRISISPSGILAPWSGQTETVHLRQRDLDQLRNAMRSGGVFTPLADRLELPSESFYWIVAACRDGAFSFNAYRWPSTRFDHSAFPKLLLAWDPTGIPLNQPRNATPEQIYGRVMSPSDMRHVERFDLAAEGNGLIGLGSLF